MEDMNISIKTKKAKFMTNDEQIISILGDISQTLKTLVARKFNYNRSVAAESLIACGLEYQKGDRK